METVQYKGEIYSLTSQPTTDNCAKSEHSICYMTYAKNATGDRVKIEWEVLDDFIERCDAYTRYAYGKDESNEQVFEPCESEACDWDKYTVTEM